jgi:hypothetical protein
MATVKIDQIKLLIKLSERDEEKQIVRFLRLNCESLMMIIGKFGLSFLMEDYLLCKLITLEC